MKYILTLFLLVKTIFVFGQSNVNFKKLINSWIQGKTDQNGNVMQADINRGGWYLLNINPDTTLIFGGPSSCGFGYERHGNWTLNNADTTVTFSFSKKVGYMYSPGTTNINEIEIYKINKLTEDELILMRAVDRKEIIMPFIKTKK